MSERNNPPDALRKRGIERVTSNLNGGTLRPPPGTLWLFFKKELMEQFTKKRAPCRSSSD